MTSAKSGVFAWIRRVAKSLSGEAQDRADLNLQLRQALERGLIDADALQMLEGVLEVADLQVRDIMVPRSQMVAVRRDEPAESLLPIIVESGHSRYPVIDDDRDDVVGILLAKDVLRRSGFRHARVHAAGGRRAGVKTSQRPAQRIPS